MKHCLNLKISKTHMSDLSSKNRKRIGERWKSHRLRESGKVRQRSAVFVGRVWTLRAARVSIGPASLCRSTGLSCGWQIKTRRDGDSSALRPQASAGKTLLWRGRAGHRERERKGNQTRSVVVCVCVCVTFVQSVCLTFVFLGVFHRGAVL